MNIFWRDVLQKNGIDLSRIVDVQLHPWLRNDMLDVAGDIFDPTPVFNAKCLH